MQRVKELKALQRQLVIEQERKYQNWQAEVRVPGIKKMKQGDEKITDLKKKANQELREN